LSDGLADVSSRMTSCLALGAILKRRGMVDMMGFGTIV
jgi:hypothetical protein